MQIYLDYSATTPPRPEVIAYMQEILTQQWGNPSSLHTWGERAATIIELARIQVADLINASYDSIIFTSGGTEADNLAIMGVAQKYSSPQHVIISSVEHSAVAKPVQMLEKWGWQVTYLPVNHRGRVNPWELKAALQENTVLVSVIYAQSEIGTLQPIKELASIARARGVLFHTDAVQAAGRLSIDVQKLGVDLLSLSSHKIYGSQGAGALYIRPGVKLVPLLAGGGQEMGLRSGTQAVSAIGGFGLAAQLALQDLELENLRLQKLRDRLFNLLVDCPYLIPTGDRYTRLSHHVSFIVNDCPCGFPPLQAEDKETISGKTIVRQLNMAGIGISSGAACNSGKLKPSSVLLAMGYSETEAKKSIRLTLGRDTTEADIDWTAMVLQQILQRFQVEACCSIC